ncbi:M20/M25/M40 family metallo-hydrolase [Sphingobacterium sp. SRCM116780]|uniref:M20/M25/M40 family metallo-hydrolase n=1 Tax=Sphingobacterium sp. SRCM116780 TaxID=2907623 RepID=UPI001F2952DC|nr:M20/M25/M40 family metallo-hydrolase [Sphingobacterium sp. SRCM116780]UIR55650.1 M20/M25/M40 family metallo-hydrolase [Sphingobacterium sp. SRCM116780]
MRKTNLNYISSKRILLYTLFLSFLATENGFAQSRSPQELQVLEPIVKKIVEEANQNSHLESLAFELLDVVGPRLVGTPGMTRANEWALAKFESWGIAAQNQKFGEWRGWERGISHIDMMAPRVKTLAGTQLAWSPSTKGKSIQGEVIALPDVKDSLSFNNWLPSVKGKFVMISMPQPTGRPDHNWEEFGTKQSIEKMNKSRDSLTVLWNNRIKASGMSANALPSALEDAGAVGILTSNWSREFGANKIFGARSYKAPSLDISLEDYAMLYRLAEKGIKPKVSVETASKDLGNVPSFNTIAEIKGSEFPNEYVILSAHLDSWEGGSGATDNGTGTIAMMEVARILKKIVPNPKRTILIGLWGSEEQGLNGSRSFVLDNPDIIEKTQAVFNLDNGTGRVERINGSGFVHAYDFISRWISAVPTAVTKDIKTEFPGLPGGGGSDHSSFVAAGVPSFMLSSLSWGYFNNTWHTNLDTYDKLVFDDLKYNVILTAVMAYKASEEPKLVDREQRVLPLGSDGKPGVWPPIRQPRRTGVGY